MDDTTQSIARFATGLSWEDLPSDVVEQARLRVLDTVACAIGGHDAATAEIALTVSPHVSAANGSIAGYTLGRAWRTTPESAAFANTCMIRSLDFNDRYPGAHPSDMLGALLATAEAPGVDGRRLLLALVVSYEVATRLADAADMRNGWDAGYVTGLGAVAGLGSLLRVDEDRLGHALSLVATANVSFRSTRAGRLSMWKGAATAHATFNAVYLTRLAVAGMTGPDRPVEGRHGLWEQITGPFELAPFPTDGGEYLTLKTSLKYWPVEYSAQNAVWAAKRLATFCSMEDLTQVRIGLHHHGWREIGSEPAKWDPRSRETADHSLPYIFVRAMQGEGVDLSIFEPSQYLDPEVRPLMAKVSVEPDERCDAVHPDGVMLTLDAVAVDGRTESFSVSDPPGFWSTPMTSDQVKSKFLRLVEPVCGSEVALRTYDFWSDLASQPNLVDGVPTLAGRDARDP